MPSLPRSFTEPSVRENAPALSGIYGIANAQEWLYIGVSDNIQEALLEHLQETRTLLVMRRPTGFVFETCERAVRGRGRTGSFSNTTPSVTGKYSASMTISQRNQPGDIW